jgi:hypothetical protein
VLALAALVHRPSAELPPGSSIETYSPPEASCKPRQDALRTSQKSDGVVVLLVFDPRTLFQSEDRGLRFVGPHQLRAD